MLCPFLFEDWCLEASNVPRFLVICIILLFVFGGWVLRRRSFVIPSTSLFLLLLGFYVFNLSSTLWSLNSADAFYESQKIILVPLLLLVFINWIHSETEEFLLVKSMLVIALLYCFYAVYQVLKLPDLHFETLYGIVSFSEHKTILSSYLFLLLPFSLYGLFYFQKFWKAISVLSFVLLFILVCFLQVRSVYLALVVTAISLGSCFLKVPHLHKAKLVLIFLACIGAILLLFFLNPSAVKRLDESSYSSGSGKERIQVWRKTLELIKDQPLIGVGAGNWQYNFSKYGVSDVDNISKNEITFQRPHNDLLWILSENGVLGFSIIAAIIILIFRRSLSFILKGNFKAGLFFSFLFGLLVESFFSFPKERISHIVLASLLLALLIRETGWMDKSSEKINKRILMGSLIILCFSVCVGLFRLKGEYYTVKLLLDKNANDPAGVIANGNKAISFFYKTDPTSTPIYSYEGWAYSALNKTDSLLYVSEEAYKLAPYDFEVLSNYGLALDRTGKREEARKILNEALSINKYYEPALINLVVLEYNSKNYKEALRYLSMIASYEVRYKGYLDKINAKLASF